MCKEDRQAFKKELLFLRFRHRIRQLVLKKKCGTVCSRAHLGSLALSAAAHMLVCEGISTTASACHFPSAADMRRVSLSSGPCVVSILTILNTYIVFMRAH